MLTYLLIYFLSFLFAYAYSKSENKSAQRIFLVLTFLIIFIPYGFRYGIGTDYLNYTLYLDYAPEKLRFNKFEIGWWPLLYILKFFNLKAQWFFAITAFVSVLIIFIIVPKEYFYLCIPVYIAISYLSGFSAVRQEMATVIFLLAFKNWFNEKYKTAILWGFIACTFHFSAVFLLIILPFTRLKWRFFNPGFNTSFFILLIFFITVADFGNFLMNHIVIHTRWSKYVNHAIFSNNAELGTGLGFLLKEFICLITLLVAQKDKSKNIDVSYNLISIYTVMFGFFLVLGIQIQILGRLKYLFDPFYIYMIIWIARSKLKWKHYAVYIFEVAMFLLFVKTLMANPVSDMGGLGLVPYSSVFFK